LTFGLPFVRRTRASSAFKEAMRVSQYHIVAFDPTVTNSPQALEVDLVGPNRRVLDVGCSTGFLGEAPMPRISGENQSDAEPSTPDASE